MAIRPMPSRGKAQRISAQYGFMSLREVAVLQDYVRMLGAETVINIGAGYGTSGAAILEALEGIKLVTVDISPEKLRNEIDAIHDIMPIKGSWRQIENDSGVAGHTWHEGRVGLVFVDGDHSFEAALQDMTEWAPHVRPGGFMAIHDSNWDEVAAAIAVFTAKHPDWAHNETVGTLMIIQYVP